MQQSFNVLIASNSEDYRMLHERLCDSVLMPFEQACRQRLVVFRYDELKPGSEQAFNSNADPVFCIVGTIASRDKVSGSRLNAGRGRPGNNRRASNGAEARNFEDLVQTAGATAKHVFFYVGKEDQQASREGAQCNEAVLKRLITSLAHQEYTVTSEIADIGELAEHMLHHLHGWLDQNSALFSRAFSAEEIKRRQHEFADEVRMRMGPVPESFEQLDVWYDDPATPVIAVSQSEADKAMLVAWSDEVKRRYPETVVIFHCVEADGVGHDHGPLVRHLFAELHEHGAISMPAGRTIATEDDLGAWARSYQERDVLLVLVEVNVLADESRRLGWLASTWSPRIRLLLSSRPGEAVDTAQARNWKVIPFAELLGKGRRRYGRKRSDEAEDRPKHDDPSDSALDPDDLERTLMGMLFQSAEEAIGHLLTTLPKQGAERKLLSLLWASRRGLTVYEVRTMMNVRKPETIEIYLERLKGLVIRAGGATIRDTDMITLPGEVRDGIGRLLVPSDRQQKQLHATLGKFFIGHPDVARRAEEALFQLLKGEMIGQLRTELERLDMFAVMIDSGRSHELYGYWMAIDEHRTMADAYRVAVGKLFDGRHLKASTAAEPLALLLRLASFFSDCGIYDDAINLLEQARSLHQKYAVRGDMEAYLMAMLGEVQRRAGKYPEAIASLRETLALLKGRRNAGVGLAAQVENDLGLAIHEAGRRGGIRHLQNSLRAKIAELGSDDPSTAETFSDLALVHNDRGDYRLAIGFYKQALKAQARSNRDHPRFATYLNNLAGAWNRMGRPRVALALYRCSAAMRERLLAPKHPNTLVSRLNVALVSHRLKLPVDALNICRELSRDILDVLSSEHPQFLATSISLGKLLRDLGELEEAQKLLRQARERCIRLLGNEHRLTAICLQNLAGVCKAIGYPAEALEHYTGALRVWRAILKPGDPQISSTLRMAAEAHQMLGSYWEAVEMLVEAYKIYGRRHERAKDTADMLDRVVSEGLKVHGDAFVPRGRVTLATLGEAAYILDDHDNCAAVCAFLRLYLERHRGQDDAVARDILRRMKRRGCQGNPGKK